MIKAGEAPAAVIENREPRLPRWLPI